MTAQQRIKHGQRRCEARNLDYVDGSWIDGEWQPGWFQHWLEQTAAGIVECDSGEVGIFSADGGIRFTDVEVAK
jgi:hypothetical protein